MILVARDETCGALLLISCGNSQPPQKLDRLLWSDERMHQTRAIGPVLLCSFTLFHLHVHLHVTHSSRQLLAEATRIGPSPLLGRAHASNKSNCSSLSLWLLFMCIFISLTSLINYLQLQQKWKGLICPSERMHQTRAILDLFLHYSLSLCFIFMCIFESKHWLIIRIGNRNLVKYFVTLL